jgi:hypothetical protein
MGIGGHSKKQKGCTDNNKAFSTHFTPPLKMLMKQKNPPTALKAVGGLTVFIIHPDCAP